MNGQRNEQARARRHQTIKEQLSLTSVPRSDDIYPETGDARQRLTSDNHFGWAVLNKTQAGDGHFPLLTRYYEKPDISGKEFEKVTYVLYMDKGIVVDKDTAMKHTQTAVPGTLVRELKPEPEPEPETPRLKKPREIAPEEFVEKPETKTPTKASDKKRKLISEFYYIPRDRSRSPRRDKSIEDERFHGDYEDYEYEHQKILPEHLSKSEMSEIERDLHFDEHKEEIMKEIEKEKEEVEKRVKMEAEKKKEEIKDKFNKKVEKRKRISLDAWKFRVDKSAIEHAKDIDTRKEYTMEDTGKDKENAGKRMKMEAEKKEEGLKDKVNNETEKIKRNAQDTWKLRAGAENTRNNSKHRHPTVKEKASGVMKTGSSLIENLKFDPVKYGRGGRTSEHLMESPSGTNKYLYVNGNKTGKRLGKSGKSTNNK